jgi:hypothetical protein
MSDDRPYLFYGSLISAMGITSIIVKLSLNNHSYIALHQEEISEEMEKHPEFKVFQRNFLIVFLLVAAADWFQGPYIYAVYEAYGLSLEEIGSMFLIGYLTSMISGPIIGVLADRL